jgi:hypothetical protein
MWWRKSHNEELDNIKYGDVEGKYTHDDGDEKHTKDLARKPGWERYLEN